MSFWLGGNHGWWSFDHGWVWTADRHDPDDGEI